MIAELVMVLAGALGGSLGFLLYARHRRRSLARDDASGRPLVFSGSVLGRTSYCHPAGGMLRVDGTSLTWMTGVGGLSFPVPVERLDVRGLTDVSRSESYAGGRNVAVVCDDAGTTVRIVVLASDLPYVARALPGLLPLLASGESAGART